MKTWRLKDLFFNAVICETTFPVLNVPLSVDEEERNIEANDNSEAIAKANAIFKEAIDFQASSPQTINEILAKHNIKDKTLVVVKIEFHDCRVFGVNTVAPFSASRVYYKLQDLNPQSHDSQNNEERQDNTITPVYEDFDNGVESQNPPQTQSLTGNEGTNLLDDEFVFENDEPIFENAGAALTGNEGLDLLGDAGMSGAEESLTGNEGLDLLDGYGDTANVGANTSIPTPSGNTGDGTGTYTLPKPIKDDIELYVRRSIADGYDLEQGYSVYEGTILSTLGNQSIKARTAVRDYFTSYWRQIAPSTPASGTSGNSTGASPSTPMPTPQPSGSGATSASSSASSSSTSPSPSGSPPSGSGGWSLPRVSRDAFGYAPMLDRSQMLIEPIYGEPEASDPRFEESRINSQAFAEWALTTRRYASNSYLTELAKKMNLKVNSVHFANTRIAMGIPLELAPEMQAYTDAYYRTQDYLEEAQNTRITSRIGTDATGKTRSMVEIEARWWDKLFPGSEYNKRKKSVEEELNQALIDEAEAKRKIDDARSRNNKGDLATALAEYADAKEKRKDLEYARSRLASGYKRWDSAIAKDERAVATAQGVLEEIREAYDPRRGERLHFDSPSSELAAVMRARNLDDATIAFGQDNEERARYAAEEAAQLRRQREREKREMRKTDWGYKVGTVGEVAGLMLGGSAGAKIGSAIGNTLGRGAASVANAFGILKGATDKLVETWKRFRAWIEESVNQAFALAPYSGKISVAKAWFQGKDYLRQIQRARHTEEQSLELVENWDKLLDETQALRDSFVELKFALQSVIVYALSWVAKGINKATPWLKEVTGEKSDAMAWVLPAEIIGGIGLAIAGLFTLNPLLVAGGATIAGLGTAAVVNNHLNADPGYDGEVKKRVKENSLYGPMDAESAMRVRYAEEDAEKAKKRLQSAVSSSLTQKKIGELARESAQIEVLEDGTLRNKTSTNHNTASKTYGTILEQIIQVEGEVARELFETDDLSQKTVEKYQKQFGENWTKNLIMARIRDKGARDYYEDAIAFNDMQRGSDYFQGYRHLQGRPATERDVNMIHNAINNVNLALYKSNEYLLSLKESNDDIAENTKDKDNMLVNGPLFEAMERIAGSLSQSERKNYSTGSVYDGARSLVEPQAAKNVSIYGDMAGADLGVRNAGHKETFRGGGSANIGRAGAR